MNMNEEQIAKWRVAGLGAGIGVLAPCKVLLSNGSVVEATALVMVGPSRGMVVDADWSVIEPHAAQLVADGFGYSVVTVGDDDDLVEMLRDWNGGGAR